jgi:hypothetical protein
MDGAGERLEQRRRLISAEASFAQLGRQAAARNVLEGTERSAIVLADFVDGHDIRMLELRDRLRLDAKSLQLIVFGVGPAANQLERHGPLQLGVMREVHDAHPTPAKFLFDAIPRN